MNTRVAVLLKEGFEEIEAIVPIDVLKRLDFDVVLAGDGETVTGAHNVVMNTEEQIAALTPGVLDAVILPGGMPGSVNLRDDSSVLNLVTGMYDAGKIVAAICAAAIVFAEAGIMKGKTCTGYPMDLVKKALSDADYTGGRTETDGNIVTGKGPGAAFEFAVAVAAALGKEAQAKMLMKNMFVNK